MLWYAASDLQLKGIQIFARDFSCERRLIAECGSGLDCLSHEIELKVSERVVGIACYAENMHVKSECGLQMADFQFVIID